MTADAAPRRIVLFCHGYLEQGDGPPRDLATVLRACETVDGGVVWVEGDEGDETSVVTPAGGRASVYFESIAKRAHGVLTPTG